MGLLLTPEPRAAAAPRGDAAARAVRINLAQANLLVAQSAALIELPEARAAALLVAGQLNELVDRLHRLHTAGVAYVAP